MENKQEKKNIFVKTMERCKSLGSHTKKPRSDSDSDSNPSSSHRRRLTRRSKSTNCVVPAGCFVVCVGPTKERFVVRTKCLNHILFQALLAKAESEFGFECDGPLELPCDVEIFEDVMSAMEEELDSPQNSPRFSFNNSPYRYGHVSPCNLVVNGRKKMWI